jgi:heptaprenyl diphosphate synthase
MQIMKISQLSEILALPGLARDLAEVEREMLRAVAPAHPSLSEPARRVIESRGKRLRPTLVLAAAGLGLSDRSKVIAAAAAIELIHIGTIVHDDIIDHAATRWGTPTISSQEGSTAALLVGDYLLALAGSQAAAAGPEAPQIISQTIAALCAGQSHEQAEAFNADRTVEGYLESIRGKTAALLSAACRLGGLTAGLPDESTTALAAYGESFGMAFQLTDDLLDLLSTPESVGKPAGHDIGEGVYTLPLLLALQSPAGPSLRPMLGEHPATPPNQAKILAILLAEGAVDATMDRIRQYNASAVEALAQLPESPIQAGLAALPGTYMDWATTKITASA